MAGGPKSQLVNSNVQLTSAMTLLHSYELYSVRGTLASLTFTEVNTTAGGQTYTGVVLPATYSQQVILDPPYRFASGVSVSIPTSCYVNMYFERGG